jgi:hypothetical protein
VAKIYRERSERAKKAALLKRGRVSHEKIMQQPNYSGMIAAMRIPGKESSELF